MVGPTMAPSSSTTGPATTSFWTGSKTSRTIKPGSRALGIAFSDSQSKSCCAGAVVRADRVVDGFAFSACTVGDDATGAVCRLVADLDRPDITALLVAGVAPAWFNLLDIARIHEETGLPVLSVSFEASEGLAPAIREELDGEARQWRLERYEALPPRYGLTVNDEQLFVRAVGAGTAVAEPATDEGSPPELAPNSEAARIVRGHTPEGGRPEPLRVARLAARAGRSFALDDPDGQESGCH